MWKDLFFTPTPAQENKRNKQGCFLFSWTGNCTFMLNIEVRIALWWQVAEKKSCSDKKKKPHTTLLPMLKFKWNWSETSEVKVLSYLSLWWQMFSGCGQNAAGFFIFFFKPNQRVGEWIFQCSHLHSAVKWRALASQFMLTSTCIRAHSKESQEHTLEPWPELHLFPVDLHVTSQSLYISVH